MKNIDRVRKIIAEALYIDEGEVTPEASLVKDLGAESIDFLDIVFRLEREFSIKVPKGILEQRARGGLSDEEFAVDGRLTSQAIANLRNVMPESLARITTGLTIRDIPALFTATTFARLVDEQLFGVAPDAATGTAREATKNV